MRATAAHKADQASARSRIGRGGIGQTLPVAALAKLTDRRISAGDHGAADKVRTTCFAYLAACLA
jgi:hypothetical protein